MPEHTMAYIALVNLEFGYREVGKYPKEVDGDFKPDWIFLASYPQTSLS